MDKILLTDVGVHVSNR